jgi:dimethylhistidine N-methyltransferase
MATPTAEQRIIELEPTKRDEAQEARHALAEDVLVGLSETPKRLNSRFFYDAEGSALFQAITDLEEYYPTRVEHEILTRHAGDLLARFSGEPLNLIDLGAGDGRKTRVVLEKAVEMGLDIRYVPIDISADAMRGLVASMGARFPTLPISGLVSEYTDGVRWLGQQGDRRNLMLFLGSNIGNFHKAQARAFLRRLWMALNHDDRVLVGFDLKKDIERLLAAYNDRDGVTARFNLNLLTRINRELDADFDLDGFRHFSTYNVFSGAMESYLVSMREQTVRIGALHTTARFAPWEPIHTEYSYKYLPSDIEALAERGGFREEARFLDEQGWFCDALWRVDRSLG